MALHSVFLPGESHGQRSLVGSSPRGLKESDTTGGLTLLPLPQILWSVVEPSLTRSSWQRTSGPSKVPEVTKFQSSVISQDLVLVAHGTHLNLLPDLLEKG